MDILGEMTKEEIITWIRKETFMRPRNSNLLWVRYYKKSQEILERRKANIEYGLNIDLKKRDEYAKQFNATKDVDHRVELMKKMEPYEKQFQVYIAESEAITKLEKDNEKLYKRIEIERGMNEKQ